MSLLTNLVAYWKLDEASGATRVDAHATFDLTDNNTVGAAAGKINDAASFNGFPWLSRASSAEFQPGDTSFSFSAWVKLTDKTNTRAVLGKSNSPNEEYFLSYDTSADRLQFWVYSAATYNAVNADTLGSPSSGTWYFIACGYDAAANECWISVNDGTVDTLGSVASGPTGSTEPFRVGAYNDSNGAIMMNGLIDEVGYWSRRLTAQEITDLYNGGAGLSYDSFGGPAVPPDATYAADSQPCEGSNGTITPTNTGGAITSAAVASGTLPTGYVLNADGTISKTGASMVVGDIGTRTVYVDLTNAAGTQSNVPVPITITANPPVISYAGSPFDKKCAYGSSTANVTASGPAVSTYALSSALSGLSINAGTGQLTFNPTVAHGVAPTGRTVTGTSAGGQVGSASISVEFHYEFTVSANTGANSALVTMRVMSDGGISAHVKTIPVQATPTRYTGVRTSHIR